MVEPTVLPVVRIERPDPRDEKISHLRHALAQIEKIGWREGTKFGERLVECRNVASAALRDNR